MDRIPNWLSDVETANAAAASIQQGATFVGTKIQQGATWLYQQAADRTGLIQPPKSTPHQRPPIPRGPETREYYNGAPLFVGSDSGDDDTTDDGFVWVGERGLVAGKPNERTLNVSSEEGEDIKDRLEYDDADALLKTELEDVVGKSKSDLGVGEGGEGGKKGRTKVAEAEDVEGKEKGKKGLEGGWEEQKLSVAGR